MKHARILIVVAVLCAAGCQSSPTRTPGSSGAAKQAAPGDGGTVQAIDAASSGGVQPPPPPNNDAHCEAYVPTKTPLSTAWVDQQVANQACSSSPPAVTVTSGVPSASTLYAACTEIASTPLECTLTVDMQTCQAGHWTKLCQHNADCPTGTVCFYGGGTGDVPATLHPQFGTCEKACTQAGSAQCGRCDMVCNTGMRVCVPNDGQTQ